MRNMLILGAVIAVAIVGLNTDGAVFVQLVSGQREEMLAAAMRLVGVGLAAMIVTTAIWYVAERR